MMDPSKLKEIQYHALSCQITSSHCCSWSEDNSFAALTKSGILTAAFQRLAPMVFLITFLLFFSPAGANDITFAVFGNHHPGIPAAFGDFNSDELTDLFTIRREGPKGSSVEILLGSDSEPLLRPDKKLKCSFKNHIITSVVPGDFDHDVMMDVMVTATNGDGFTYVYVHKGSLKSIECAREEEDRLIKMKGQPIAVDYNKDMIIDLFGEDEKGRRSFWQFPKNLSQADIVHKPLDSWDSKHEPLRSVHSNAFLDLNLDSDADLYITSEKYLELWFRTKNGSFEQSGLESLATVDHTIVGQTTFLDFQSTGELYHLVPFCNSPDGKGCKGSEIKVYQMINNTKLSVPDNLQINFQDPGKRKWGFAYDSSAEYYLNAITLRAGDFNMDGFPDLLVTLSPETDYTFKQTFLLENVECTANCGPFQRTFAVRWTALSSSNNNTILGVFYDFFQDGILDVIFVNQNNTVTAFRNSLDYDANFLKAMVISSVYQNYEALPTGPLGKKYRTYGTNLPGPTISYSTTTPEGQPQKASSAQLPQSAHFSLILPYTIFGLGRSPNFIDSLTVNFFGYNGSWYQLIPNSQIIVIPFPLKYPSSWRTQLFVTPSKIILQSVFALLGTCLLISAIIAVLYWKERKEDKREKLQQAHRFHFDAM